MFEDVEEEQLYWDQMLEADEEAAKKIAINWNRNYFTVHLSVEQILEKISGFDTSNDIRNSFLREWKSGHIRELDKEVTQFEIPYETYFNDLWFLVSSGQEEFRALHHTLITQKTGRPRDPILDLVYENYIYYGWSMREAVDKYLELNNIKFDLNTYEGEKKRVEDGIKYRKGIDKINKRF